MKHLQRETTWRLLFAVVLTLTSFGCDPDLGFSLDNIDVPFADRDRAGEDEAAEDEAADAEETTTEAEPEIELPPADPDPEAEPEPEPEPDAEPDLEPADEDSAPPDRPYGVFVSWGDPYARGPKQTREYPISAGDRGAPYNMHVYYPRDPDVYAVVVFHHGYQMRAEFYGTMLERLASHGFIVVAPQLYEPKINVLGLPNTTEERDRAKAVIDWFDDGEAPGVLARLIGVTPDVNRLAVTGHSRGGKIAFMLAVQTPTIAKAVFGVDPVDSSSLLITEPRITNSTFSFGYPVAMLGTAYGPLGLTACAPANDGHTAFWNSARSPAWRVIVQDQGHNDMLNDETPDCIGCGVCQAGSSRDSMRVVSAGYMAAFLRHALQGDFAMPPYLSAPEAAPSAITIETK